MSEAARPGAADGVVGAACGGQNQLRVTTVGWWGSFSEGSLVCGAALPFLWQPLEVLEICNTCSKILGQL